MEWKREHNTAQKKKEANCGELNEENTLRFPSLRSIIVVYCNEKELNKRGKTNEERMRVFLISFV